MINISGSVLSGAGSVFICKNSIEILILSLKSGMIR